MDNALAINTWVNAGRQAEEVLHLNADGTLQGWMVPSDVKKLWLNASGSGHLNVPLHGLPSGIRELTVWGFFCDTLGGFPEGLERLEVQNDPVLHTITDLPEGLKILVVDRCAAFRNLPEELPHNLDMLNLSKSSVRSLPPMPHKLFSLNISFTQIVRLPPLPKTLHVLDASFTPLTGLPELPIGLMYLWVTGSAGLLDVQDAMGGDDGFMCDTQKAKDYLNEKNKKRKAEQFWTNSKEELVATAFSPRKHDAIFEKYGYEGVDAWMM